MNPESNVERAINDLCKLAQRNVLEGISHDTDLPEFHAIIDRLTPEEMIDVGGQLREIGEIILRRYDEEKGEE